MNVIKELNKIKEVPSFIVDYFYYITKDELSFVISKAIVFKTNKIKFDLDKGLFLTFNQKKYLLKNIEKIEVSSQEANFLNNSFYSELSIANNHYDVRISFYTNSNESTLENIVSNMEDLKYEIRS